MGVLMKQWRDQINGAIRMGRDNKKIFEDYCKRDRYFRVCGGIGFGKSYINNNLKGKKMNQNVFEVLAIQEHEDKYPTILVPITTVVAKDTQTAIQNFLIENAAELTGKENVQTLCRPFC